MSNYFDLPSEGELELAHHGILGQKWGIRRYQNADGSLTEAGRARYGSVENLRKIQNARADAAAYKIRVKAQNKAAKAEAKTANKIAKAEDKRQDKIAKEDLKREKKYLKEQRKYQVKENKKYIKETEKQNQKYYDKNNQNRGNDRNASKQFANDAFNQMVKPVLFNTGRNILTKYADNKLSEFGMSDVEKQAKRRLDKAKKKLEEVRVYEELARKQASMNENAYRSSNEYGEYRTGVERNRAEKEFEYEKYMRENYTTADLNALKEMRKRFDVASGRKY